MFRNGLEPWHLIVLLLAFILLFGYKKLPDAARSIGRSMRIFKAETKGLRSDNDTSDDDTSGEDGATAPVAEAAAPAAPAKAAPSADKTRVADQERV
jgi:sec-independent protein translocase protein TatA